VSTLSFTISKHSAIPSETIFKLRGVAARRVLHDWSSNRLSWRSKPACGQGEG